MVALHQVPPERPPRRPARGQYRPGVVLLVLCALLAVGGCKRPGVAGAAASGSLKVTTRLAGEAVVGVVPVVIEVSDAGVPVLGARVDVEADMTHAGMAPATATASEVGDGTYRADDLVLGMAGDWIVSVKVTTAGGVRADGELLTTVRAR
ncbi:MAG TPA: FixH family protein [Trueperaceae bacterium]|nr:FixH family protein [Trueperaceae bacterium]